MNQSELTKIYYAHCVSLYGTAQEARDLLLIESFFPMGVVINPNAPHIAARVAVIRAEVETHNVGAALGWTRDAGGEVMDRIFQPLVQTQDLLVFRALPDGSISSGVAKEIQWAEEANIPILELPSAILRRTLTVDQTRQFLRETGHR